MRIASDLKITFSIKNTGVETYKILNTPTSLLSTAFKTDKFLPKHKDTGKKPIFKGIKLNWNADGAALAGDFFSLRPGQTAEVIHNLKDLYDFSQSGPGPYVLSPMPIVELVVSPGKIAPAQFGSAPSTEITIPKQLWQTLTKTNHEVERVAIRAGNVTTATLPEISNCSPPDVTTIHAAIQAANAMLVNARQHVGARQAPNLWDSALTREWFGRYDPTRSLWVNFAFTQIQFFQWYKYDCACADLPDTEWTYAYVNVYMDQRRINLCPRFFDTLGTTGYSSRGEIFVPPIQLVSNAGTLIHE
ncbi:hypothetical protein FRC10_001715 [Ceratobasidium sp. 414]|nr:hypothetical protein FRC10_001715 [Ceratobasidium sp. 414]